jgi:hypothetical protein
MDPYILSEHPAFKQRVKQPKQEAFDLLLPKFQAILARGYVVSNQDSTELTALEDFIMSYIDYFGVPKAAGIRVGCNGASCGLNETVWAPNFWLPMVKSACRVLNFNYCGVDLDLGELFLNFPLPLLFRAFSGINLTPFKEALGFGSNFDGSGAGWASGLVHNTQFGSTTGLKNSLEETDKSNPLRWDEVRLNLPGDPAFDPTLPKVIKWDMLINNIAGDVKTFVDDLRALGIDEETAWRIARQFASRLQYLGIQDAPRARPPPTRKTGAWAGAIFSTKDKKMTQTV